MKSNELFDGYSTYTSNEELSATDTSMDAAYTPSSGFCIRTGIWAVRKTIEWEC